MEKPMEKPEAENETPIKEPLEHVKDSLEPTQTSANPLQMNESLEPSESVKSFQSLNLSDSLSPAEPVHPIDSISPVSPVSPDSTQCGIPKPHVSVRPAVFSTAIKKADRSRLSDLNSPIKSSPVGNFCYSRACGGGLFLPMGVVPELKTPSYFEVKNRAEGKWYTDKYKAFLSQQLWENNEQYSKFHQLQINLVHPVSSLFYKGLNYTRKMFKK